MSTEASKLPTKSESEVTFREVYCQDGHEWDAAGREAFEKWWRGETNIATPLQTARILREEPPGRAEGAEPT